MHTSPPAVPPGQYSDVAAAATLMVSASVVGGLCLVAGDAAAAWWGTSSVRKWQVLDATALAGLVGVAFAVGAHVRHLRRAGRLAAGVQARLVGLLAGLGFAAGTYLYALVPIARSLDADRTGTGTGLMLAALPVAVGLFAGLALKAAPTRDEATADGRRLSSATLSAAFAARRAATAAEQRDAREALAALDVVREVFVRTADAGEPGVDRVGNAVTRCLQHVEESEGVTSAAWKENPALTALLKSAAAYEEAAELRARPSTDTSADERCQVIADAYGLPVQPPHALAVAVAREADELRDRAAAAVGLPAGVR